MDAPDTLHWSALLIVKDTLVRDLIALVVARLGGEAIPVDSELAARKMVADRHPEVVILDLLAPGINSLALIRDIRAQADSYLKGLIAVSGLAYREVVERTVQAGATDFLVKPIDTEQLVVRLEKLVLS